MIFHDFPCDSVFVVIFFKIMYKKKILDSVFVNNQGQTLIIPDIIKTSPNNRMILDCVPIDEKET